MKKGITSIVLVIGLAFFLSCGNKKKTEEFQQEIQTLQTKVNDLEKEVAARESSITQLKTESEGLKVRLPEPYEVQPGDSHWKIVYDFLTTKKGLPDEAAKEIIKDTPLFHPINVGFRIWNYFSDNVFGSFPTQGNATVSPAALMRMEKRKAEEERLRLETEIVDIKKKAEELNKKIAEVQKEKEDAVTQLKGEISSLNQEVTNVMGHNKNLDSRLNSVYYLAGTKNNLKSAGKIKGTFLGICGTNVGDVTFADFPYRMDLREVDFIEVRAADVNVTAIKKVELLPKELAENKDYRVEIAAGGDSAKIYLTNKDKFLLARIIFYVN